MRMRDLIEKTGLPKTTIHHYLREGLLQEPVKASRNSAVYSEAHVQRLGILKRLRSPEFGPMPFPAIRRVLELIDQGVEPDVAIVLQRNVMSGLTDAEARGPFTLEELAEQSGADPAFLREAVEAGLIVASPGNAAAPFDDLDLRIARMMASIAQPFGFAMSELAPIAAHIREVSAIEMELRNRVTEHADQNTAATISAQFQEAANFLHTYLFTRARQHDIAEHGLGTKADREAAKNEESTSHD